MDILPQPTPEDRAPVAANETTIGPADASPAGTAKPSLLHADISWLGIVLHPLISVPLLCAIATGVFLHHQDAGSDSVSGAVLVGFMALLVTLYIWVRTSRGRALAKVKRHAQALERQHGAQLRYGYYLGGVGTRLDIGGHYLIGVRDGEFQVRDLNNSITFSVPLADVREARAWGRGAVTTNAGVIGGGFGLEGMAEGMALAAVLNGLTSKTQIDSLVRVASPVAEATFAMENALPHDMDLLLAPVRLAMRAHASQKVSASAQQPTLGGYLDPAPLPGSDVVTQLQSLAEMHSSGVLSAEEFAAAKSQLLG